MYTDWNVLGAIFASIGMFASYKSNFTLFLVGAFLFIFNILMFLLSK